MATWYLDQENGNDANAGTSFANRKKTLQSIAAAGWAAGDTVRVMASAAPTSLGVNGTWTLNSTTMTLASAVTKNVELCNSGWTGATNVTLTHNTNAKRQGTASAQAVFAAGFTTGVAMYKALGASTDFSAYQQISFWIYSSVARAASDISIRLCSDTLGATPVNTINCPALDLGIWTRVVVNTGGALGNAIQSVSVSLAVDPGTSTIRVDNIFASKSAGSADALTLFSLIGTNNNSPADEHFLAIQSVDETTIEFCGTPDDDTANQRTDGAKWYGSTQTTTAYVVQPIIATTSLTYSTAPTGDTNTSAITIEGGYNRTDMSTRTGRTYMRRDVSTVAVVSSTAPHGIIYKYIGVSHCGGSGTFGAFDFASASGRKFELVDCVATGCGLALRLTGVGNIKTSNFNALHCYRGVALTTAAYGLADGFAPAKIYFDKMWGVRGTLGSSSSGIYTPAGTSTDRMIFLDIKGNQLYGWYTPFDVFSNGCLRIQMRDVVTAYTANTHDGDLRVNGILWNVNLSQNLSTGSKLQGTNVTVAGTLYKGYFRPEWSQNYLVFTATDQRHTASDVAWKVNGIGTRYENGGFRLCSILCKANITRTVKVWTRRDNTGTYGRMRVLGGLYNGIPSDVTATAAAAINTWEQLTISFTPTEDCVVEVRAESQLATGGGNKNVWFDDLEVS